MSKVVYEKRNRIGYITLNRPEALNALDDELNDALWEVWADFNADESVDVAIVTGAGKAFCSGADLKSFIPKWEHATMLDVRKNAARGILANGQQAIRSAKETILEVIGRPLDDALRLETVNGYSSVGDFREVAERLQKFFGK